MRNAARIAAVISIFGFVSACATFRPAREPAAAPSPAPKRAEPKPAKLAEPVARKLSPEPLVEAFRCSMRVGQHLNTGIRIYSSIEKKDRQNVILYGSEMMDVPPTANDHQVYLGATAVVAGENGGSLIAFRHPRIEIEISVTHNADIHTPLMAEYTDRASGALNVKGTCTLVSPISY